MNDEGRPEAARVDVATTSADIVSPDTDTTMVRAWQSTPESARATTNRILDRLHRFSKDYDWLVSAILAAKAAGVHTALGYNSWTDYISREFKGALFINTEDRQALVRELVDAGMSTRAIAPIVGVSQKTVVQDKNQVIPRVSPGSCDAQVAAPPARVVGVDGKDYPASYVDRATGEVGSQLRARAYSPRTDVVRTISSALTRARSAAELADQIKAEHLKNRGEEIVHWRRSLGESIDAQQRLLDLLVRATPLPKAD